MNEHYGNGSENKISFIQSCFVHCHRLFFIFINLLNFRTIRIHVGILEFQNMSLDV